MQGEKCGSPIGPTKKCALPKGHVPSTACWHKDLHKGKAVERDCPEPGCTEHFVLVPVGLPTTEPFAPSIPDHWEQLPPVAPHAPPKRGNLCPGSGK